MGIHSYSIEFTVENDAFHNDESAEVIRILKDLCNKIEERGLDHFEIFDINGNHIGCATLHSRY